jgi:hypothetical protein
MSQDDMYSAVHLIEELLSQCRQKHNLFEAKSDKTDVTDLSSHDCKRASQPGPLTKTIR